MIKTYEGSNLVSDSQQDLVGERYLAEQIRLIQEQQRQHSFLDKWGHLLYEGEKEYKSPSSVAQTQVSAKLESALSNADLQSASSAVSHQERLLNLLSQQLESQQLQQSDSVARLRSTASKNSLSSRGTGVLLPGSALSESQSRNLSELRLQQALLAQAQSEQAGLLQNSVSEVELRASADALLNSPELSAAPSRQFSDLQQVQQTQQDEILAYAQAQAAALAASQAQYAPSSASTSRQNSQNSNVVASANSVNTSRSNSSARVSSSNNVVGLGLQTNQSVGSLNSNNNNSNGNPSSASLHQSVRSAQAGGQSESDFQQPQPFLPQLSNSNLNAVNLEAYNSPQFKALLEQLSKPINIPPQQINYPPDWPSQDKISKHILYFKYIFIYLNSNLIKTC